MWNDGCDDGDCPDCLDDGGGYDGGEPAQTSASKLDEIVAILVGTPLFRGLDREQVRAVVDRLNGRFATFEAGEPLFPEHRSASAFDYLVEGRVEMRKHDVWGGRHILGIMQPGSTIGGLLAFSDMERPPVEAVACTPCRIIAFDRDRMALRNGDPLCESLGIVIQNYATTIAASKFDLMEHCYILSHRSVRKRLLCYLSSVSQRVGSRSFTIPFDRQQLADYLNVDRSVLSSEISALRSEGVIACSRNSFEILK